MKNIFLLLLAAGFVNHGCSQSIDTIQKTDTIQTVDYGKMPPVYFSNKVYWERNYDKDNHLLYEALKYNSCFIGSFVNYWSNGKTKTKGQYLQNNTGDWNSLQKRGLCSVQNGEWKVYNEMGDLINTITYDKGKIIKEQH